MSENSTLLCVTILAVLIIVNTALFMRHPVKYLVVYNNSKCDKTEFSTDNFFFMDKMKVDDCQTFRFRHDAWESYTNAKGPMWFSYGTAIILDHIIVLAHTFLSL